VRELTFTRADTLLFGAVVAILVRESDLALRLRTGAGSLIAAAALCLAVILVTRHWLPYEAPEMEVLGYSSIGLLFATLIYTLATRDGILSRYFSSSVLRWFGKYSYAIYVFQAPLAAAFKAMLHRLAPAAPELVSALIVFASTTAVSCGAALLSWYLLESRFLRLKRYFGSHPSPAEAPVATLRQAAIV
jgi:peptidoglycan/LPS O-acetylase OafA/YrhL